MEYFNPYFEIFALLNYDRRRFFELLALIVIQRWIEMYMAYILFYYSPIWIFLTFLVNCEIFFQLYLTNLLYYDWITRRIQETNDVNPNTVFY